MPYARRVTAMLLTYGQVPHGLLRHPLLWVQVRVSQQLLWHWLYQGL